MAREKRLVLGRMLLTVLTIVFLLFYGALIFFYFHQWRQLTDYQPPAAPPRTFVSVLIAARNEETTLPLLLEDLHGQTYPASLFEIIVVNDYSTDRTGEAAKNFAPQVRMLLPDVPPEHSSKKAALATGIKAARGQLILVTDADCRMGSDWVQTMAAFYQEKEAAFIAAPVRFVHDGSLLQVFQVLDFLTLQGITAAGVSAGLHTLCNGANLAYTKQAFDAVNGFAGIDRVATGDDLLLMNKIWKQHPGGVFYLKSKAAIVSTAPMKTWSDFLMQRRRWASKTLVYDDWRMIAVLLFVLLLNLLFFALLAAAFFNKGYWLHLLFFLAGKTIIEWPFVSSVAQFYGEQKLMRQFFFLQPLHIFYTVIAGVLSQFGKYAWKGRRTR